MTETKNDLAALAEQIKGELSKSLDNRDAALVERLTKQFNDEANRRAAELEAKVARFSLPGSAEEKHKGEKFSVAKAALAIATNRWDRAPLEAEVFKAMATLPDASGGYLVPAEILASQYLPLLKAESVVEQLGATVLRGLNGVQFINKQTQATTARWVGAEGTEIGESDAAWGQLRLEPHALAAFSRVSLRLMEQSAPAAEDLIRKDMIEQLALARDLAALKGSGASGTPTGIINAGTGLNTVTLSSPATYNQLWDMVTELMTDNAHRGNLGWAMSVARFKALAQITDAANQDLERRVLSDTIASTLLGYPYRVSSQLAATDMIFGNFADLIIGEWSGLRLEATQFSGSAFQNLQVHVRAYMETDISVARTVSFCIHA